MDDLIRHGIGLGMFLFSLLLGTTLLYLFAHLCAALEPASPLAALLRRLRTSPE